MINKNNILLLVFSAFLLVACSATDKNAYCTQLAHDRLDLYTNYGLRAVTEKEKHNAYQALFAECVREHSLNDYNKVVKTERKPTEVKTTPRLSSQQSDALLEKIINKP